MKGKSKKRLSKNTTFFVNNKLNELLKRVRKIKYARLKSRFGATDLLSRREKQVLNLIVKGGSSSGIGKELGISKRNVEAHRDHILKHVVRKNAVSLILFFVIVFGLNASGQKAKWVQFGLNQQISSSNFPLAIITDHTGNVIEAGNLDSTVSFGSYTLNTGMPYIDNQGAYLVKYDSKGNVLWALSNAKSNCYVIAQALAADGNGNIYMAGYFGGNLKFGSDSLQTKSAFSYEFFIAKFDPNGHILWLSGDVIQRWQSFGIGLTVDPGNNVYLQGLFIDSVKIGPFTLASPYIQYGLYERTMFIAKYSPSGKVIWANKVRLDEAGNGGDPPNNFAQFSITSDTSANIYAYGIFHDSLVSGSIILNSGGTFPNSYINFFLLKYDSTGTIQWATNPVNVTGSTGVGLLEGPGLAITTDMACNLYITGQLSGTFSFGAFNVFGSVFGDAFLVKYNSSGKVLWTESMSVLNGSNGSSLSADKWGHIYMGGNSSGITSFGGQAIGIGQFAIKLDTNGRGICGIGTGVDGFYTINGVAAAPFLPDVYITGVGFPYYLGGKYTGIGGGFNTFIADWTCDTCKLSAKISGFTAVCAGQKSNLTASNGSSYLWDNGSNSPLRKVAPLSTTTYTLYASSGVCFGDTTFTVSVVPKPVPSIIGITQLCQGDSVTLTGSGGSNFLWSNGDTSSTLVVKPSADTSFRLIVSKGACSSIDSVGLRVFNYPVPSVSPTQYVCAGNAVTLTANGGSTYSWSTGASSSSINPVPSSNSTYTVQLNNGPCSATDSIKVILNPLPTSTACCDTSMKIGESTQLTSSLGTNYSWSPESGLSCSNCFNPIASPNFTTIYTVTVSSDSGCTASSTVTIEILCGDIFVPDAFSPNGDGENDILFVRGVCIESMDFMVFNRWGEKVFESTNPSVGWNGIFNYRHCNQDVFVYYLNAKLFDGTKVAKEGHVTLLR